MVAGEGRLPYRVCENLGMSKVLILFSLGFVCLGADVMPPEADQRLAREIYKEMIESKSGFTTGTTTDIAEAVATRLKAAGFPAAAAYPGLSSAERGEQGVQGVQVVRADHGVAVRPGRGHAADLGP